MTQPAFNPSGQIRFDLGRGKVSVDNHSHRVVVPATALATLLKSAGEEAAYDFGRSLGTELGRRAATRLSDGIHSATTQEIVDHIGGELALCGLGALSAERWGDALVFRVDGSPLDAARHGVLGAVLEGALQRALSRDVVAVCLAQSTESVRFLLSGKRGAEKVRTWLSSGLDWGQALTQLQVPAAT